MDELEALGLADDLRLAYPGRAVTDRHIQVWAKELRAMSAYAARKVVQHLSERSVDPPSRAQLQQAYREVNQETMSPAFDFSRCVFVDGVVCPACSEIHGHIIDPGQAFHSLHHLGRRWEGEPDTLEQVTHPEDCECGFEALENVDVERVFGLLARAAFR